MADAPGWREWRDHWKVIVPCFLGIMLVSSQGYSLGVMIRPLEQEFGWPRAQISMGSMFMAIIGLVAVPIIGTLVDRIGPRRIGLTGIVLYCASFSGLSLASSNIQTWWGLYLILAFAGMTIMPVVWVAVINGYFFERRGLALAIALSGTGMGAAVWPSIANTLVEAYGWRTAYVGLAMIGFIACFPAAWLLFRESQEIRTRRSLQATARPDERAVHPASALARQQMRSVRFYKLAGVALIFALANGAISQNLVLVLLSEGMTPAKAAATAGLLGIGSILGRVVGGFLLDRFDGNKVAAVSVVLPLVTVSILLGISASQFWAGVACLVLGFSIGAELDCCAYLTGRHFGTRNFGALFGTINGLLLFGAGMAPVLANLVYDSTRSYDLILIGLIPTFLLTAILFLTLGDYRQFDPETGEPLAR